MTDLEERIISFTAERLGVKARRILLSSRLAQDLGTDGDDAVDLFQVFGEEFHVDLTALWDHWGHHFVPEGFSMPSAGCLVLIGASVIVGDILNKAVSWIPSWAWAIILTASSAWLYNKFFVEYEEKAAVTVNDLVEAAALGKRVMQYEVSATLFRSLP